jgi:hypothetical protein
VVLPLSILYGESRAGDRCDMEGNNEGGGKSRRLDAEEQRWSSIGRVLSGWTIGRLGDAVCGMHHAQGDEERMFLG